MLIFFFWVGIGRGLHAILLGHVALALPYVIVVVGARLKTFGPELEEAAATLGANQWQAFWRVTAADDRARRHRRRRSSPSPSPSTSSSSPISWRRPAPTTLPVEIYAAIRKGFTPEINAISPSSSSSRWG